MSTTLHSTSVRPTPTQTSPTQSTPTQSSPTQSSPTQSSPTRTSRPPRHRKVINGSTTQTASTYPKVLYVLKRFPQLSQTFVVRELVELERIGVQIGVDALAPIADGPVHDRVGEVAATVRYLPKRPKLGDAQVWRVHLAMAVRRPTTWVRLALRARRGDWRRFVQAGLVADRIRKEGYEHVHAHFASAASEVARDAAALAGCRYSVTAHAKDIFHEQHAPNLASRLNDARVVVTVSSFNERHLRSVVPDTAIVHIPNAVGVEACRVQPASGPILCVARLVEKKGIDTLLRALALCVDTDPSIHAEVIGGGDLLESLTDLRDELGLHDQVMFLGPQSFDEVDKAYQRCTMVVLPCRIDADGDRDGLPTVIVEAFARGVPVISTSIIGIPEVVRHNVTGLLVEPDDPMALASAMVRLLEDRELASALGRRGRDLVVSDFDPRRSAERLAEVFASAVKGL